MVCADVEASVLTVACGLCCGGVVSVGCGFCCGGGCCGGVVVCAGVEAGVEAGGGCCESLAGCICWGMDCCWVMPGVGVDALATNCGAGDP